MKHDPDNIAKLIGFGSLAIGLIFCVPYVLSFWTDYADCQRVQTKYAQKGDLLSCKEAKAKEQKEVAEAEAKQKATAEIQPTATRR